MAVDGKYAGHIVISDIVKPHAEEAVAALKAAGVEKTVMLTGDSRKVGEQVASVSYTHLRHIRSQHLREKSVQSLLQVRF